MFVVIFSMSTAALHKRRGGWRATATKMHVDASTFTPIFLASLSSPTLVGGHNVQFSN
jgi:hypothetical protein